MPGPGRNALLRPSRCTVLPADAPERIPRRIIAPLLVVGNAIEYNDNRVSRMKPEFFQLV
jgi:hypothetical protein